MKVNEVKFDKFGFAYVRLYVKPNNAETMMYLPYKVDSGANITTISKNRLNRLGYDDDWVRKTGRSLEGANRPTVATGNRYR